MPDENTKTCFVIAPIDDPDTPTRKWSDQVLRHIIRPAVEPLGYKAIRADEIDKPGIITTQVLNQVVESELVIADLTERNPNVFYELAIRHAISKPFVQIIKKSEQLPFDVAQNRTVFVDLQDPDNVADSVKQITSQIESLESDPEDVDNPISVSINLQRLLQSPDPEQRSLADVLSALSEIQGRISNYGDVSSKFDSVLHAIQEQPLIGSRRERSIPLQLTLRIARGSDSPFGSEIQGRISNYGDVSSKFDSVLHAIQEQPLIGSRRERSIPLQLTLRIARGSDSLSDFWYCSVAYEGLHLGCSKLD